MGDMVTNCVVCKHVKSSYKFYCGEFRDILLCAVITVLSIFYNVVSTTAHKGTLHGPLTNEGQTTCKMCEHIPLVPHIDDNCRGVGPSKCWWLKPYCCDIEPEHNSRSNCSRYQDKYLKSVIVDKKYQNNINRNGMSYRHGGDRVDFWIDVLLRKFALKGDCLVADIGANVGTRAVLYAEATRRTRCKVFAYEPIPQTFNLIPTTLSRNRAAWRAYQSKRLQVFNLGFSDSPSLLTVKVPDKRVINAKSGGFSLLSGYDSSTASRTRGYSQNKVRVTTVSAELGDRTEEITFVKIDCEGLDLRVISGMTRLLTTRKVAAFIWEHHGNYETMGVINSARYEVEKVASFGYHVYIAGSVSKNLKSFRVDGVHWRRYFEVPGKGPYFGNVMDFFAIQANHQFEKEIISKSLVSDTCIE